MIRQHVYRSKGSVCRSFLKETSRWLPVLMLLACATAKPSAIDSQLTGQGGDEQSQKGLRISIRPLHDSKEVKKYFSANLLDKRILPVFILAENASANRCFLVEPSLENELPELNGAKTSEEGPVHDQGGPIDSKTAKEMVDATDMGRFLVTTGPIIWLAILPLMVKSDFQYGPTDASRSLQQAMIAQSFRRQTLTPGKIEQGFLYYRLPSDDISGKTVGISIKATDSETMETMSFRFTKDLTTGGE